MRISYQQAGGLLAALLMSGVLGQGEVAAEKQDATTSGRHQWFSIPIEVRGVPNGAEYATVVWEVDFTDLLGELKAAGAVDERTLRLYQLRSDGADAPVPVQFRSFPQPRPEVRRLFEGTPGTVSYIGEYGPGETPEQVRVAGRLTWIARQAAKPAGESGPIRFRLDFGVPISGRQIQVPFPPQNLRGFDEQNRATPVHWFNRMQIRPQWPMDGAVRIYEDGELVTTYQTGPGLGEEGARLQFRRPFFYPVNGPDGISLTEFGKPNDPTGSHAHHYSLWIAHANVDGHDFWSERGGRIHHEQFELMEDGPVYCRLIQKTRWIRQGKEMLRERRQWTFYASEPDFRLIDLDLELMTASDEPVVFGRTSFGFLAARVAQSMTVFDGGGEIINAEGDRNEQGAHLKRAAWIDQSGPIGADRWGGLAIFDHPDNPNHPTGWHCRNDGWAGASFNMEQPHAIAPGESLKLRYRIHLHRHDSVRGRVAERYREYQAEPFVVSGKPVPFEDDSFHFQGF